MNADSVIGRTVRSQVAMGRGFAVRKPPFGAILLIVLLSLFVISLVMLSLARMALLRERQVRQQEQNWQAFWLAEAGLDRARSRLSKSADYAGETWRVEIEEQTGVATISVAAVPEQSRQRRVTIEAIFPDDPLHRVMQRRETVVKLP